MSDPQQPASPQGGTPPQNPYGAPPQNPYGGYSVAPPPGVRTMEPGTIGYVEAHFGPVAGFGDRVLALLIDYLVALVALLPAFVGLGLVVAGVPKDQGTDLTGAPTLTGGSTSLVVSGIVVVVLAYLLALGVSLWNRVLRMGRTGQSIGKSRMGLVLIDARSGAPIGAGRCFARELLSALINQAFYLSYLWMLWDPNRLTLADMVMTSTVVKRPTG